MKTFEQFLEGLKLDMLYHVSSKEINSLDDSKILWVTDNLEYALKYGNTENKIIYEVKPIQTLNVLDTYSKIGHDVIIKANKKANKAMQETSLFNPDGGASSFVVQDQGVLQYLRKLKYDAVKTSESYKNSIQAIAIINTSKVKINKYN